MLHLYYLIRDSIFFKRKKERLRIIQRMPKIKILQIHDFGLTMGIVLIFVAMAFWHKNLGILTSLGVFALFIILTRVRGWLLVSICTVLGFLFMITGGELGPNFWSSIKQISAWYIAGYISGFIFALTYNECVYLSLKLVHCCKNNIFTAVFAYKENNDVNILKSPIKNEEVEIPDSRFYKKFYQYDNLYSGDKYKPYTITFIANPFYKYQRSEDINDIEVRVDPIINNPDLFLHTIDRALMSFESDQVLGRPGIWSRVKIVAIFPGDFESKIAPHLREDYTLVGRIPEKVQFDRETFRDLLAVDEDFEKNFKNVIDKLDNSKSDLFKKNTKKCNQIDVVYILSSNLDYTRSTALFSEGKIGNASTSMTYKVISSDGIVKNIKHEHYAKSPGKVALNLLTARQKTFIHEFGHAMSHFENGAVVDEYFNEYLLVAHVMKHVQELLQSKDTDPEMIKQLNKIKRNLNLYSRKYNPSLFIINKLSKENAYNPVPKSFMDYNEISYYSDRDHPSAEEHWNHFFPLRESLNIGCTMDRTLGQYKFDKLISDFMYDRLMVKVNRK